MVVSIYTALSYRHEDKTVDVKHVDEGVGPLCQVSEEEDL